MFTSRFFALQFVEGIFNFIWPLDSTERKKCKHLSLKNDLREKFFAIYPRMRKMW